MLSEGELIYTFLFKVLSSGKLVVENYLHFQKMRCNDKKRRSWLEQNVSEARQIMIQSMKWLNQNLLDEITEVKREISKYRQLAFKHRFSLSFIASFEDAFQCSICQQTPARPPIIACSAWSTLAGCETCTNEWYRESSLDKRCPKCRS